MHRRFQLGMRENPASERRHGSRLAASNRTASDCTKEENPDAHQPSQPQGHRVIGLCEPLHAAPPPAATGEEETKESHLLTVHEVAELLQVPVSWVYTRTRKRSTERLPGYRLGKYWRFRETEVLEWISAHCGYSHAS